MIDKLTFIFLFLNIPISAYEIIHALNCGSQVVV